MESTVIRYERPWLYPKQEEALFCDERYSVIEATTKGGKTVGALIWLFEQAITGGPNRNYWWVAPVYTQAAMAYRRLKRFLRHLPPDAWQCHNSDLWVSFSGGGQIWFKSAEKPDNLYGEDVYGAVFDEASRGREESWYALRSTLTATRGPIRIIGNVRGRKNWAYRIARRAEAGAPGMRYAKITWRDAVEAGVLDMEEIEDARRTLPGDVFRELFEAEPSDGAGNPFGLEAIADCVGPLSTEPPAVWGWDLAKSQDWTVGVAMDAEGGVCEVHRYQMSWSDTEEDIDRRIGDLPAVIDATGVGSPVVERLQKDRRNVVGYVFTAPSKQKLMGELKAAIQSQEITYPEGVVRDELEEFEYDVTRTGTRYSAPEGMHDDAVCALALANHARLHYLIGEWWIG